MRADVGATPRRAVVERRRLLDRLEHRFEVRLTTVVGGAGSGKTTLLAQAMAAERTHVDVWVPCGAADRDDARLIAHVAESLGDVARLGSPTDLLARVTERIVGHSPRRVCIVLDDAHLLGAGRGAAELLAAMPANGHLLVAGRALPPLDASRLDAAGQLVEVAQDELLMTESEVAEFANLRGVDSALLTAAEGWPAFVELASSGTPSRTVRYLDEQALHAMPADHRHRLAAFVLVGGGDDEIARAVAGVPLDRLVDGLPLVRWTGDTARLHDLWDDLLADDLDGPEQLAAVRAAVVIALERREIDRAIDLSLAVDDRTGLIGCLRAAVRDGVRGGLRTDQIRRWRSLLADDHAEPGLAMLLDGLLSRERDPTDPDVIELLDGAATRFAVDDTPDLELVALTQLGYVARIVNDTAMVRSVADRFDRLAERYAPARPFRAIGEAWSALTVGDMQAQLDALMSVGDDDLPGIWQITRRHLIAHALFNLGRAADGLAVVPDDVDALPVPIPGALVTHSQCLWYSGRPELALAEPPRGGSDRHGARDRFIAAGWEAMMRGYSGDVGMARAALERARQAAGTAPGPMVVGQLIALEGLIASVSHDDDAARERFGAILAIAPLEDGLSAHMLRNHVPVVYSLVPGSRRFWDTLPVPPVHDAIRSAVQALVAATEHDDLGPLRSLRWPEPGLAAAFFPVRYGIELALHGVRAERHEGRHLAAWLCEHWTFAGREELQRLVDDDVLGQVARDVLAHTPAPPLAAVELSVLGPTHVSVDSRPTAHPDWRRERVRALAVWLALHPRTAREQAAAALWPDLDQPRSMKNLRTTLNYLHGILEPSRAPGEATWFVRGDGQRLELHSSLPVDLHRFDELLTGAAQAERAGRPLAALPLLEEAIDVWRGDLAADLDYEWLDLDRIHARSRFVRAACRAAELSSAIGSPDRAIEPARRALEYDPYHTASHRALAEAYRGLGDTTSATTISERAIELGVWD